MLIYRNCSWFSDCCYG